MTPPIGGAGVIRLGAIAGDRDPADGRHRRHLPMRRHLELAGQPLAIERPELPHVQSQRLRLKGHVRDRLAEVV
ncbi:MAG: hypothetical protein ACXVFI_12865, partial [Solirubrobacteraceae bacterium]